MKRLGWPWWLALCVLTLLFMLVQLPAGVLGSLIAAQTGQKFSLAGASGSIWRGTAQPVLDGQALAGQLSWQWQAGELLHGRLGYALQLDEGRAELGLGLGGLLLRNADLTVAAAPLFRLIERTRPYGLEGQLRLSSSSLRWHGADVEGQLSLDWRGAASSLAPAVRPLGDYRAQLQPAAGGWKLQLSTLGGPLQLNGSGNWQASQGFEADIGLRAEAGSAEALAPFLSQIGGGAPERERRLHFRLR